MPILAKDKGKTERLVHEIPVFPLDTYLETDNTLKPYTAAFKGIHICSNVLQWSDQNDHFALLGSFRTEYSHLLVDGDKVTLLTQNEAKKFVSDPNYYNLSLGFTDPNKKLTRDQLFNIVKLKFLNGESQFSKQEIEMLKDWFKPEGIEKMQKLYLEHVINGYPQKIARYQNSPLQKLFGSKQK